MDASQTRSAADPETIMYHNKNNNAQKRLSPSLADTGGVTPGTGTSKPRNRANPTYKSKQRGVCFGEFVLLLWEANVGDYSPVEKINCTPGKQLHSNSSQEKSRCVTGTDGEVLYMGSWVCAWYLESL